MEFREFEKWVDAINTTAVESVSEEENMIVTHNGIFHCDEVVACVLLKVLPRYRHSTICRTRDARWIEKGAVVVDVGGVYDPVLNRFDHHQSSFTETFYGSEKPDRKTRLSSAGLVFKTFGSDIIRHFYPELKSEDVELINRRVYNKFVEEIDGLDNGIEMCSGGEKNYRVTSTLTSRIALLRPYPEERYTPDELKMEQHSRFREAMEMAAMELFAFLDYQVKAWLPARRVVLNATRNASEVHPSGKIIKLEGGYVPWKPHLKKVEEELGVEGKFLFCIFKQGDDGWAVQACPSDKGGFSIRTPLKWQGLNNQNLIEASGIPGCIFVHGSGFMGSNKTFEGALKMAEACLQ